MRFNVEPDAALFHPHGRGNGPHLNLVGRPLHMQVGQDLLGDPPSDDGVDRSVFNLLLGQMGRVPVALLLRLIELEVQIGFSAVSEAGGVLAEHQPAGLQRAVELTESDAGRLDEGQLEGHIVGDDAHAFEQLKDADADAVEINDQDAVAAVEDLQEPDAGATWIETGGLGVLDRGRQLLSLSNQSRDLVGWGLELLERPVLARAASRSFTRLESFST